MDIHILGGNSGMEVKKVNAQQTATTVDAKPKAKAEPKKEEEGFFGSIWSGVKKGAQYTADGFDATLEFVGWRDIERAIDKKNERSELWTKETKGAMYVSAAAGNFAAQGTDVHSRTNERITEYTEKVDSAVDAVAEKAKGNKPAEAAADLLKSVASPVKIINSVLNFGGGTSDEVSAALKLEGYTNEMITKSTDRSLGIIADKLKDYSDGNVADMKTSIDLATRLGIKPEELAKMDPAKVRELIKNEHALVGAKGKVDREITLHTGANAAADALIKKNTRLMGNQTDEGLIKLDKAQKQIRSGASELLNAPAALVDLTNSGIGAGVKALGANDATVRAVEAPLNTVTGLLQTVTTSFDGKEGTTKKAAKKLLSGVTFGLFGNDEEKPAAPKAAAAKAPASPKPEVKSAADEIKRYNELSKQDDEKLTEEQLDEKYSLEDKYGFFNINGALEDGVDRGLIPKYNQLLQTYYTGKLTNAQLAEIHELASKLGIEAPKSIPAVSLTRAEFDEKNKAHFAATFAGAKDKAMKSDAALTSRATYMADKAYAEEIANLEAAKKAVLSKLDTQTANELDKQIQAVRLKTYCVSQQRLDDIAAYKAQLKPKMQKINDNAEAVAAALAKKDAVTKKDKIDAMDAKRLAQRAENAGVAGTEFWNHIDGVYSNADNTAGDRGAGANTLSVIKGFAITPLRALLKEPITTANKTLATVACHEVAGPIVWGDSTARKAVEAIKTVHHGTYNTALKKSGYEKGGEALFYLGVTGGLVTTAALPHDHCWHFESHGQRYHFGCGHSHKAAVQPTPAPTPVKTPDEIFLTDPSALTALFAVLGL